MELCLEALFGLFCYDAYVNGRIIMTFSERTIVGGFITGVAALAMSFIQITDQANVAVPVSYILPMIAAMLVAYYVVFSKVKKVAPRLGAATGTALMFLALMWALNELLTPRLSQFPPVFGIWALICLLAAAFAVAVAAVVWIAKMGRIKLAVS
jgi:hypothetical protein